MVSRRSFIKAGAALSLGSIFSASALAEQLKVKMSQGQLMPTKGPIDKSAALPTNDVTNAKHYRPEARMGLGGLAAGNGFNTISSDTEILTMLNAAWDAGIRHYDTSRFMV
ncbi:hypothetical protein ACOBV9_21755 (plasmid) [Pseudoalteromonas espejiana]